MLKTIYDVGFYAVIFIMLQNHRIRQTAVNFYDSERTKFGKKMNYNILAFLYCDVLSKAQKSTKTAQVNFRLSITYDPGFKKITVLLNPSSKQY
jgi:hypothetical protein